MGFFVIPLKCYFCNGVYSEEIYASGSILTKWSERFNPRIGFIRRLSATARYCISVTHLVLMIDLIKVDSLLNPSCDFCDSSQCECQDPSEQLPSPLCVDSDENLGALATAAVICCNKTGKNLNLSVIASTSASEIRPGTIVAITFISCALQTAMMIRFPAATSYSELPTRLFRTYQRA